MSQQSRNVRKQSLDELKQQLQQARPIMVDSSGQLRPAPEQALIPQPPAPMNYRLPMQEQMTQPSIPAAVPQQAEADDVPEFPNPNGANGTRVKPSRWF